jgi:hypothetical protein
MIDGFTVGNNKASRNARAAANRARIKRDRAEGKPLPFGVRHGENNTYTVWQCRCGPCRAANAAREAARKTR